MDAAARARVVDTSLNLGLVGSTTGYEDVAQTLVSACIDQREDQGRVASIVCEGGSPKKELYEASAREFERVVSEKKKLETQLLVLSGKYVSLVDRFSGLRNEVLPRKRKAEYSSDEEPWKRPRESNRSRARKVYYPVDASDTSLVVKDGYQWRKYGQKVTRDNPSPRAYFRCSFAPSCPTKKKVQRSIDNPTILIATYQGEHNHGSPACGVSACSAPSSPSPTASSSVTQQSETGTLPKLLVQQMAMSLTMDPAFTSAVAAAISGTVLNQMLALSE